MNRSDKRKLEIKTKEFDKVSSGFERSLKKAFKEVRFDLRSMFDWYFFYKPKDKADRIWHFICVLIVDVILLRIFGLI